MSYDWEQQYIYFQHVVLQIAAVSNDTKINAIMFPFAQEIGRLPYNNSKIQTIFFHMQRSITSNGYKNI